MGAGGAEPSLQTHHERDKLSEISLQNLAIGFGNCLVLLLLLVNAKEEIKLHFVLYPSTQGSFSWCLWRRELCLILLKLVRVLQAPLLFEPSLSLALLCASL